MDQSPRAHAGHDEALIARLFGGDVGDAERAQAVLLLAECPDCESLFADLAAIAAATAELTVPPRPRNFTLTEADAARLRGKTRARWRVLGLGLRRSLGGSLAALGILGVIATGASSVVGEAASNAVDRYALTSEQAVPAPAGGAAVASAAGDSSNLVPAAAATAAPAATAAAALTDQITAPSAAAFVTGASSSAASIAVPDATFSAGPHDLAPASPALAQVAKGNGSGADSGGPGSTRTPAATSGGSSGLDVRILLLIGSGAVFVLGLGLAILPARRRGKDRGARA